MPAPYQKKAVCSYFMKGGCTRSNCQYAHPLKAPNRGNQPSALLPSLSSSPASSQATGGVLGTLLRLLFEKQQVSIYDPDKHSLHLNAFKSCPDLRDITSAVDFNVMNFCDALCKTIAEVVRPPPTLISVDNNNIRSMGHFIKALERHGLSAGLRGLSAQNNLIDTTEFTQQLKGFINLTELVLTGNPVTKRDDYKRKVRQHLPRLQGLDMESTSMAPLCLPWPVATPIFDDVSLGLLNVLHANFFSVLECKGGTDTVAMMYASDACFSLVMSEPTACALQTPTSQKTNSSTVQLCMGLRQKQLEADANLNRGSRDRRAHGRVEICSSLRGWLYPAGEKLTVRHLLHPAANVALLTNGMKLPTAVVSVHGVMEWSLPQFPDVPIQQRNFVRTLSLVTGNVSDGQQWQITSDMLQLIPTSGANPTPVFEALNKPRLDMMSRRKLVPEAVVAAAAALCSNDTELDAILSDLTCASPALLDGCSSLGGGDVKRSIDLARIANQLRIAPNDADAALASIGGDIARLGELMQASSVQQQ